MCIYVIADLNVYTVYLHAYITECVSVLLHCSSIMLPLLGVRVGVPSHVYVLPSHVYVLPSHVYVLPSHVYVLPSHVYVVPSHSYVMSPFLFFFFFSRPYARGRCTRETKKKCRLTKTSSRSNKHGWRNLCPHSCPPVVNMSMVCRSFVHHNPSVERIFLPNGRSFSTCHLL